MEEKKNTVSFYAAAVTKGQKKRLLAAYKEYLSLVHTMESLVKRNTVAGLAAHQTRILFPDIKDITPWSLDDTSENEKRLYRDFINSKKPTDKKYCFVSLDLTTANNEQEGILSIPNSYQIRTVCSTLPHCVERYVVAFPEDARLKETTFIINGKYAVEYENHPQNISLADAFDDELMEKRFYSLFEILGRVEGRLHNLSDKELRTIQNEAMASELAAPFENTILSAFAALTEEANHALKDMLCRKNGDNYLFQAESGGIIPSAARFQDYQNIRHLLHHQWDTLDNIGRFTFYDVDRNASVRARYLDSYKRLCNHRLNDRIKSYAAVVADFAPLVQGLSPELLIRREGESHSKFIARLKAYKEAYPQADMLVETGYAEAHTRKQSLIKQIEKQFPTAEIIDRQETDMDSLFERMKQYTLRKRFLDMFASIEYKICQHFLFLGRSQPANKCWSDLTRTRIIVPEDIEKWNEYRKIRNIASHHHLDKECAELIEANFVSFIETSVKLENELKNRRPHLFLVEGDIYRAVHPNGKVVELDFKNKRVLNTIHPSGKTKKQIYKREPHKTKNRYIEEHNSGVSITLTGTEISALRMSNGVMIDLKAEKIVFPNYTTLYFNSADHNSIISKGSVKLLTDKNFRLTNYISKGKSVEISKNEILLLPNASKLTIGPEKNLETATWQDSTGAEQKITYNGKENIPFIRFNDGTTIRFKSTGAVISHAGIELTYHTRKAFAESYLPVDTAILTKNKNNPRQ